MIKYYDLNLSPKDNFNAVPSKEAICSFISNEIIWVDPKDASKYLTLEYDKNHHILKIAHHNFSMKLSDFVAYNYMPIHFYIPIQVAIANLATLNYSINIVSKNGTFHPVITQKIDENDKLLNVYILYNDYPVKQVQFTRLNNYLLNLNNDENDTTTILFPVYEEDMAFIKKTFSFLYPCKESIASKHGRLLIPNKKEAGTIFINGRVCNELNNHHELPMLYSYELSNVDLNGLENARDIKGEIGFFIQQVLAGLSPTNKEKIYPTIINNLDCLEWTIPGIQVMITKYLITTFSNEYVYFSEEDINDVARYFPLLDQCDKKVIILKDEAYCELEDNRQNIYWLAQDYLGNKYHHNFLNDELNANELNNLNTLEKFCNYFSGKYDPWQQIKRKIKATSFKFYAIKNCPCDSGYFIFDLKGAVINKKNLKTLADALETGYKIMHVVAFVDDEFGSVWTRTLNQFLAKMHLDEMNKEKKLS